MNIINALAQVAPIILLIVLGMIFRYIRFLRPETVEDMNKLVVKAALPALIYISFSSMQFESRYLAVIITMFLACTLMMAVGFLFKRWLSPTNPYYPALFTAYEIGMMGMPLFISVFGIEHAEEVAVVQLGNTLFFFFVVITFLQRQQAKKRQLGQQVVVFLKTPLVIAVLLGFAISVTGINTSITNNVLGGALTEGIRLLSSLTVPLILITIGYQLKLDRRNPALLLKVTTTIVLRLAISLLLATAINILLIDRLLQLDRLFQAAIYTAFLLPPPFPLPANLPANAKEEHRQEIVFTISMHILFSLGAFVVFLVVGQV